jgi:hypothetical protein
MCGAIHDALPLDQPKHDAERRPAERARRSPHEDVLGLITLEDVEPASDAARERAEPGAIQGVAKHDRAATGMVRSYVRQPEREPHPAADERADTRAVEEGLRRIMVAAIRDEVAGAQAQERAGGHAPKAVAK